MMDQKAGNVSTSPIIGHRSRVCMCSNNFFVHLVLEYLRVRKSPSWYDPSHTSEVKSRMAVVPNSIRADSEADFAIEVKAETMGRLLGINIMLELTIPRSTLEREKRGSRYACIKRAVEATAEAKPRKRVADLSITLCLCHRGNFSRFCIVPRNHLRLWKK